jgi:hypothetical protein
MTTPIMQPRVASIRTDLAAVLGVVRLPLLEKFRT